MRPYYGDMHSHCGASYGHGTLSDALYNARLQLDFCSVTGHSSWPDMRAMEMPDAVMAYHEKGFTKLAAGWSDFISAHAAATEDGQFIAFPSYESHSFEAGDYVVYHRHAPDTMVKPDDFAQLQALARDSGGEMMILPHHIGYTRGYRGINWDLFDEKVSPLVEIISMHGCNESDDAPFPPLHTMGPRSSEQTMQAGLAAGNMFGVTGSTDHHSAHPGSYGWGLTGVWAEGLTMEALWEAFMARRTWAMSGDRIAMSFDIDDAPMGSIVAGRNKRKISWSVSGEGPLDYVEILKDNQVLHRIFPSQLLPRLTKKGRLFIEMGWGEKDTRQDWDVRISVEGGHLSAITPKFRGIDIVDPLDANVRGYRLSEVHERSLDGFAFHTTTWGNPTSSTAATQGCGLEITHGGKGILVIIVNGAARRFQLSDLVQGSVSFHLGGFLSGAVRISRFVMPEECTISGGLMEQGPGGTYYLRTRQHNGHWAWTSPIQYRR